MNTSSIAFDVIGDVHGQADKLEALLARMGYVPAGMGYRPPHGRQALFLGDLIDRGPKQLRVLQIVWSMIVAGDARCVMGNHEFNAIAYATEDPCNPGERLRPNRGDSPVCRKNREQHAAFIAQLGDGSPAHLEWIDRLRALPPFLDLGGLRAVHGCWDGASVQTLREAGWAEGTPPLDDGLLRAACTPDSPIETARKLLTCGLELPLPEGIVFRDKSGHPRSEVRVANWRDWATRFHEVALVPDGEADTLAAMDWPAGLVISRIEGAPIFVGHHWFVGHPAIESPKLACLDWSAGKGGPLVAYRWDGEQELSNDKLVWAQA